MSFDVSRESREEREKIARWQMRLTLYKDVSAGRVDLCELLLRRQSHFLAVHSPSGVVEGWQAQQQNVEGRKKQARPGTQRDTEKRDRDTHGEREMRNEVRSGYRCGQDSIRSTNSTE